MPVYAYTCPDHGEFNSAERKGAVACPQCGKLSLRVWSVKPLYHPTKSK